MKRVLKSFIAFILIAIIIGGSGYFAYSYYFANNGNLGMNMNPNNQAGISGDATNNNSMPQQGGAHGAMNNPPQQGTQHGAMTTQNQQGNMMIIETVKTVLGNKEKLDGAIGFLNESISSLTLDPYSPSADMSNANADTSHTAGMGGMQMPSTTEPATATNNVNGSTTINIYPENSNASNAQSTNMPDMSMKDMGTRYDANKMEQLHSGLYKLSVGMQLLEQLNKELLTQAETIRTANTQDPVQYYSNEYASLLQSQDKLKQALNYINESSNLVNINPYVSENGLVYDKYRMQRIHESIFKMAKGVALLNQLDNEIVKQTVASSYNAHNAANNMYMNNMTSQSNHNSTVVGNSLFSNINFSTVLNTMLIVFVALFILGILGLIFSLLKAPSENLKQ